MNHPKIPLTVIALAVVSLTGCAVSTSLGWDRTFGDATRVLRAQQTHDAEAPKRNANAEWRADGRNVRDAVDRHGETYRTPPPSNVINIAVGAGAGP
jgi:hypothetical protein